MSLTLFSSLSQQPLLKADVSLLSTLEIPKGVQEEPVSLYRGISQQERLNVSNSTVHQASLAMESYYSLSALDNGPVSLFAVPLIKPVSIYSNQAPVVLGSTPPTPEIISSPDAILKAVSDLKGLPLECSVDELKVAGDAVLKLDASKTFVVNTVYQKHFDFNRTAGFRRLQYTPYATEGYANLKKAHQIAQNLLGLADVTDGEGFSMANELLEFSLPIPDSITSYVSPEVSDHLTPDVRAHLDRADLGKNSELDKKLLGLAYHLPFDSTLLLRVVAHLKDAYPDLVRDLVGYQKSFFEQTSPLYGSANPTEQVAVDKLSALITGE